MTASYSASKFGFHHLGSAASVDDLVLTGATSPVFAEVATTGLPGVSKGAAAWGDFDNDGRLDVLLVGQGNSSNIAGIYRNNGDGTFTDIGAGLPAVQEAAAAWGDYNNDGYLDVALSGYSFAAGGRITRIYRNNGNGTFTQVADLAAVNDGALAWGDYNNDGRLDLVLQGGSAGGRVTQLYRNDGNDVFTEVSTSFPAVYKGAFAWGDYDNDGWQDLLLTGDSSSGSITKLYHNNGDGTFTDSGNGLASVSFRSTVAWGDYDGDGDLDILLTGFSGSTRYALVYRNNGDGTFTYNEAGLAGTADAGAGWGDLDNDGDLDIAYAGTDAGTRLYRNDGGGAFSVWPDDFSNVRDASVAWGDYDRDGRLDLLVAGYDGSQRVTKLYRNVSAAASTNTVPTAPTGLNAILGNQAVTLTWNAASDAQTTAASLTYNLRVGTTSGGQDVLAPAANLTNGARRLPALGNVQHRRSALLTNLTRGQTYYWSVQAVDNAWAGGPFAAEASFTVPVLATVTTDPITVITTNTAQGGGNVTSTGGATVTARGVCWNTTGTPTIADTHTTNGSGLGTFTSALTDLTPGQTYYVRAYASSAVGTSYGVQRAFIAGFGELPTAPSDLVSAAASSSQITLTWTDNSDDQTGFKIERSTNGTSGWTQIATVGANVTNYDNTGLVANTLWYYRVCATNASGASAYTAVANAHTAHFEEYDGMAVWKAVLLVYTNTAVTLSGTNFVATMNPAELRAALTSFRYDMGRIHEHSLHRGFMLYDVVYPGHAVTNISPYNGGYWLAQDDMPSDRDLYVPDGAYDSFFAFWEKGTLSGGGAWGLTYNASSSANGSTYHMVNTAGVSPWNKSDIWWHEWLHAVCGHYGYLGYRQPKNSSDGAGGHGYTQDANEGYGLYYRDLQLNQVWETNAPAAYTGVPEKGWRSGGVRGFRKRIQVDNFYMDTSSRYFKTGTAAWQSDPETMLLGTTTAAENSIYTTLTVTGVTSFTLSAVIYVPASGAGTNDVAGLALRNGAHTWWAQLEYGTNVTKQLRLVRDGVSQTNYAMNLVTGCWHTVELNVDLSGKTLGMKAWADGRGKPDTTQLAAALDTGWAPTQIGFRHYGQGVQVDDLLAVADAAPVFTAQNAGLPGLQNAKVAWGDFNNDGSLDLAVLGNTGSNYLTRIYRNDGNGVFTDINAGLPGLAYGTLAWGDYDNDGDLDLLIAGYTGSTRIAKLYRNDGGVFVDSGISFAGVADCAAAWGDYNNDGRLDLALSGNTGNGYVSKIYRNDGHGVFTDIGANLRAGRDSSADWGDYDKDGNLDLLLQGKDDAGRFAYIYRNDGNGGFVNINAGLPDASTGGVAWGDYDGDGWLDVMIIGYDTTARAELYRNQQNGAFTNSGQTFAPRYNGSVAWGDWNNDGKSDILLQGYGVNTYGPGAFGYASIARNNGDGTTTEYRVGLPGANNGAAAWGDYDNDGRLDVAICGKPIGNSFCDLYHNTLPGGVTNTPPTAPSGLSAVINGLSVTLTWAAATDAQTPAALLTYNLRVGTTPGGSEIMSAQSGTDGFRRVPAAGNAGGGLSHTLTNLPSGQTLYWSVQAVDSALAGGPFASEGSFATPVYPTITTAPLTSIATTTASCGGNVTDQGSSSVTARGCVWNTTGQPTVASHDGITTNGSGLGSFTSSLTGLSSGVTYYVRAYAAGAVGTSYGEERTFTTSMTPPGNALSFDGSNDYVSIADRNELDLTVNYTLECWFKADGLGGLRGLISKYQAANANGYVLRLNGMDFDFDQMTTTGLTLQSNRWYHVAAVKNGGTRTLYLNGTAQTLTGTPLTVQANNNVLTLGVDFLASPRYFDGQMDEVRVWNVARAEDEIRDAMHRELQGTESGLLAYFNCNGTSSTTLVDLTTNGINGTLVNGTTWFASTIPCTSQIASRTNLRAVWSGRTNSLASVRLSVTDSAIAGMDFVIFGHDNATEAQDATDKPGTVLWRLNRVWQADVSGSVTADLQFDVSGWSGDFALLADADGYFTNATVIGGLQSSNTLVVTGVSLQDGYYYTVGSVPLATVTTAPVTGVTTNSAQCGGNVTSEGGASVTARGCVWNTTGSATLASRNGITTNGSGAGSFSSSLTGLTPGQPYYVRAYATSPLGTAYGEEHIFYPLMPAPGSALSFDGINDYVRLSNDLAKAVGGTDAITIEYWFKGTQLQSPVRLQDASGFVVAGWSATGPKHIISTDGDTANGLSVGTESIVENGQWHHLAMTWQRNTTNGFKSYLDGTLVAQRNSANAALPSLTNATPCLGSLNGSSEFLAGSLDEVRIWSVARSEDEIRDNMHRELQGTESGLVAYYNANQISGTNLFDQTANGFNGTLVNGPAWVASTIPCAADITNRTNLRAVWTGRTNSLASGRLSAWASVSGLSNCVVFGHDNAAETQNGSDLPGGVLWRLNRAWQLDERGTLTADLRFDVSGWTNAFVLLSDADGAFTNATITFGERTSDTFTAPGVSLSDGFFYTVAAVDAPIVTTAPVTNIAVSGATCGGSVTSQGGAAVTARGVCWNTSGRPTLADSHTSDGTGTGSFVSALTNLTPNVTYYVRAYAVNALSPNYGEERAFTTLMTFTNIGGGFTTLYYSAAAWGDLDNDGDLDLLYGGFDSGTSRTMYYRNNANGTFTSVSPGTLGFHYSSIALGDYDNDGNLDVLINGRCNTTPTTKLYRNVGGTLSDTGVSLPGTDSGSVAWGDYNNDGHLDFLLTGEASNGNVTRVYRNNGDGTFTDIGAALPNVYAGSGTWADFDHDGDLDILLCGSGDSGSFTRVYRNDGNGVFTDINAGLAGLVNGKAQWGDYDNDGYPDILLSGGNISRIYHNNHNGTFTDIGAGLTGLDKASVAWGDYDNDGDLDVIIMGESSGSYITRVYRNDGSNTFTLATGTGVQNVGLGCAVWGDYDQDGKLDLFHSGYSSGQRADLYRSQVVTSNTSPAAPSGLQAVVNGNAVTLSWNAASDAETPAAGLTYELRVGTTNGGGNIVSAPANATGWRRVACAGSLWANTNWTLTNLPDNTTCYWSVQAVDTALAGSAWAAEGSFTTPYPPGLTTSPVTDVAATTAQCGGTVTNQGGSAVSTRGCVWNTAGSPTVSSHDGITTNGSGMGAFTSSLTGLTTGGQIYYVRAYAMNNDGASYGEQRAFATRLTPPGNALQFDGANDYVRVPDTNSLDLVTNYTLECWFKANVLGGLRGLIGKYQSPGANGYLLRLNGAELDFDQLSTSGLNLQTGRWYHVAAVKSGGSRTLYVNGVAKTISGSALTVQANGDPLCLGVDYLADNNRFFAGQMDEVRVWSSARTLTEIQDAMHTELAGTESNLVAYFKCNHAVGTTLLDVTSHGCNGTLLNGPTWVASTIPCANLISNQNNLRGVWISRTNSFASSLLTLQDSDVSGLAYRVFGHDGGPLTQNMSDTPSTITWRLNRVWNLEGSSNLTGNLQFDCSSISNLIGNGNMMRLLVSDDTAFTNAQVVVGTYTNNVLTVTNCLFDTAKHYTVGEGKFTPNVTTAPATNLQPLSAQSGGEVLWEGAAPVTARGVCWNTTGAPTTADTHTTDGSGLGAFVSSLTGLSGDTTYFVRAYAVNTSGTSYGAERSFTTLTAFPAVTTAAITNITHNSAQGGGTVTNEGGYTVTARGVCWNTTGSPTITNSHTTDGSGLGAFTSQLTGLQSSQTYYVRAYATNSAGVSYGNVQTFTTLVAPPGNALDFNNSSIATGSGLPTNVANRVTLECWVYHDELTNRTSRYVTLEPELAVIRHDVGNNGRLHTYFRLNGTLRGLNVDNVLQIGRWYHVAGVWDGTNINLYLNGVLLTNANYAGMVLSTNSGGITLGSSSEYLNGRLDEVRVWNSGRTQTEIRDAMHRQLAGTETNLLAYYPCNEGSGSVARDLVSGANITSMANVGWAASSFPCANIVADATNLRGAWLAQTTSLASAILTVSNTVVSGTNFAVFGHNNADASAQNTSDKPATIRWRLERNWRAELLGSVTGDLRFDTTGVTNFSSGSELRLLVDADGTFANATVVSGAFSSPIFTIAGQSLQSGSYYTLGRLAALPTVTTTTITALTPTTATSGGNVTDDGGAAITARGVCWNTTGSPTAAGAHTSDGSGAGSFTSSLTSLSPFTTCFVRAYAVNAIGTNYGTERSFTTLMTPPGYCLDLDGTNDYVTVASASSVNLTNNYTLEAWIYPHSFRWFGGIVGKYQVAGAGGFVLRLSPNAPYDGLNFDEMNTATGVLQSNRWYHVAAVNSNGTRRLWLNGVEQSLTGTPLTIQTNNNALTLGVDFLASPRYFDGRMDEVRVWNVVRTEAEIRDAMHKQLAGSESGLVACYQFNTNAGTVALDLTANANTGTLVNGPLWTNSTIPCAYAIADRTNLRGVWNTRTNSLVSSRFSVTNATATGTNFAVFGHDNTADTWQTGDVPASCVQRLTRVWRLETVGTLNGAFSIDCTGLGISDGTRLRLLTDADGAFTNAQTVSGTYVAGVFTVPSQSCPNGQYYTLGYVGSQITGQVELEYFVGFVRAVTFKATATNGQVLQTWTMPLSFGGGGATANFALTNVPINTASLSAKTDWNLRRKLAVSFTNNAAAVSFCGASHLLAGDLNDSNTVNLDDYYTLASVWYTHTPIADLDGNGLVNLDDYFLLANEWQQTGDPE